MRPRRGPGDAAVSEVMGAVMLMAVTVILVGATANTWTSRLDDEPLPPQVDVLVEASAGDRALNLTHLGGEALPRSDLRLNVLADGAALYQGAFPGAGRWVLGERVQVPLSTALQPGAKVEVLVVADREGTVLSTLVLRIPDAGSSSGAPLLPGFTVSLKVNQANSVSVAPPAEVLLEAKVDHPRGRKSVHAVQLDVSQFGLSGNMTLVDDGTAGDRVAGDGTYSSHFLVRSGFLPGTRDVHVRATDLQGNSATASTTIHVESVTSRVYKNNVLIDKVAFRLLKYPSSAGNGDKVTIHLKLQLAREPVTFEDGSEWKLTAAKFFHDPFKPGKYTPMPFTGSTSTTGFPCAASGEKNKVVGFELKNETLPLYRSGQDTLRFHFQLEWQKTKGAAEDPFIETIEANEFVRDFILRPSEAGLVIYDDKWPASFTDCK